jgi:hypothetical protein
VAAPPSKWFSPWIWGETVPNPVLEAAA